MVGAVSGTRKQHAVIGLTGRRCCRPVFCFARITPASNHEVQLRLFRNVEVSDRAISVERPTGIDQVLLVWRNALPVLDLGSAVTDIQDLFQLVEEFPSRY